MEQLWAPWRIKFILEHGKKPKGESSCVFCDIQQLPAKENYVLYRHALAYVVLNIYPYNPAHLLVIPTRHVDTLSALSDEEHAVCGRLLAHSMRVMTEAIAPQGYNVGMNIGHIAGAGIPHHLHYHIVPRWSGDTNFMTVLGETRVLPESIDGSYERLIAGFDQLRV